MCIEKEEICARRLIIFFYVHSPLRLTSSLAPGTCALMYGGFLSFIYWNILFSPFINSILCSNSSGTVWLQNRTAVSPNVTYCGATSCTFICTAGVTSENREITWFIFGGIAQFSVIDERAAITAAIGTIYCFRYARRYSEQELRVSAIN